MTTTCSFPAPTARYGSTNPTGDGRLPFQGSPVLVPPQRTQPDAVRWVPGSPVRQTSTSLPSDGHPVFLPSAGVSLPTRPQLDSAPSFSLLVFFPDFPKPHSLPASQPTSQALRKASITKHTAHRQPRTEQRALQASLIKSV